MDCRSSNTVDKPPKTEYKFTVKTNDNYSLGGTTNRVYVKIVGDQKKNPKTKWIQLHHLFRNDFDRGQTSTYYVTAKDVGKPLILEIELRKYVMKNAWACDRIMVEYQGEEFTFPVEDFIYDKTSVARGTAYASSQVPEVAVAGMREREIDVSKVRFQWITRPSPGEIGWGLPRYVDEENVLQLPNIFQWTSERLANLADKGFDAVLNLARNKIAAFGHKLEDLDSYTKLYQHLHNSDNPVFFDCWTTDEEFGRQQLNGISPHSFSRCSEIPENCQITEDDVKKFLKNSLIDEMKAGKIYLADYSKVFQGVPRTQNDKGQDLYCPDAFCLYYVNTEDNFVPIAIQLVPDDRNTVFTPADKDEWLLAKMYFRVAYGNLHEWYYHFLLTHDVMETFGVAVFRCFPRSHPLYKLLRPHLQTIAFINSLARATLINPTSTAYKALAINGGDMAVQMFKDFTFDDLVIPEVLKKKGLDDAKLLPKYYYRDDALKLWSIQENFVANVIKHYYKSDKDIENDYDLQAFVVEMKFKGYGWQDGNSHGIPDSMKTRDQLIRLCTTIAFTTSAQHAAVNFRQYEFYRYIPNSPLAMRLPPPRKGEINPSTMMDALPDVDMATIAITIAYTLSSYSPNEIYLGNYPLKLFTELEIQEMETKYREALEKYSDEIKERNDGLSPAEKYDWLIPSKVPNSIAI